MVGNIMPSFWLLQRVGGSPGPTRSYILGRPYILYIFVPFLILLVDCVLKSLYYVAFSRIPKMYCSGDKICKPLEPWERPIYLA